MHTHTHIHIHIHVHVHVHLHLTPTPTHTHTDADRQPASQTASQPGRQADRHKPVLVSNTECPTTKSWFWVIWKHSSVGHPDRGKIRGCRAPSLGTCRSLQAQITTMRHGHRMTKPKMKKIRERERETGTHNTYYILLYFILNICMTQLS